MVCENRRGVGAVPVYGQTSLRDGATHRLRRDAMANVTAGFSEDFVISTGRQESVRRFIEIAAQELGWGGIHWQGEGLPETGIRRDTGR